MDVGHDGMGVHDFVANVGNSRVRVNRKFGLEVDSWQGSYGGRGTYVEDVKDPVEIQPPRRDRLFVALRVEHPRHPASFTSLDDVLLDLGHSAAIGNLVSDVSGRVDRWFNSHSQLSNRLEH